MFLDEAVCWPGMDCAREWGLEQQEEMMELSALQNKVETPRRGPSHSLQGQSGDKDQAARALCQPWGGGGQTAPSLSMGVLPVPLSRVPILPHHTKAGSEVPARVPARGGLGEDSRR